MTTYLSENEAENLQNGDVHLAHIPGISREPFGALWSVMPSFCNFHARSFERNFFFDQSLPLRHGRCEMVTDGFQKIKSEDKRFR